MVVRTISDNRLNAIFLESSMDGEPDCGVTNGALMVAEVNVDSRAIVLDHLFGDEYANYDLAEV